MKKETPKKATVKKTPAPKMITSTQLQSLQNDVQIIVNDYITKNDMSVHGFATKCKVHPTQLYLFLKSERGLNLTTVQKIADFINK